MAAGISNGYWLTMLNVTNLEGNKFVNGMILGFSELTASIFAGFLIACTSSRTAFRICCIMAILFNAIV